MLYDIQLKFTSGGWLLHPPSIASLHLASSGASPSCWPCRMHTTWHAWLDTSTPWTHVISSHLHKHTHTTLKCDQTSTPNLTYQNSHLKSQGSHLAPQIPTPQNPNLKPHTTLLKANISHLKVQPQIPHLKVEVHRSQASSSHPTQIQSIYKLWCVHTSIICDTQCNHPHRLVQKTLEPLNP